MGGQPQPPGAPRDLALARDGQGRRRDAAVQLSCRTLAWAVLDSGIDATHPAFARRKDDAPLAAEGAHPAAESRVKATSTSRACARCSPRSRATKPGPSRSTRSTRASERPAGRLGPAAAAAPDPPRRRLRRPRARARHPRRRHPRRRLAQTDAGGADARRSRASAPTSSSTTCACSTTSGAGDEFASSPRSSSCAGSTPTPRRRSIHGVNLSLSIDHDVANYACGRTPVCDECERLVGAASVVVAAAGNEGPPTTRSASGTAEGYRQISITDPGNAEGVITVGATHRDQPHTYGVSYFSSRGPTGDGRAQAGPRRARREDHRAGARTAGSRASTARAWPRRTSAAPRRC